MSTKEALLSQFALGQVKSEVLEAEVYIKQLPAAKTEAYQFQLIDPKTGTVDFSKVRGARANLVAMCLCDEDGKLLFKNGAEVGNGFPATFVEAAYAVCAEVNGLVGEESVEEAGKD